MAFCFDLSSHLFRLARVNWFDHALFCIFSLGFLQLIVDGLVRKDLTNHRTRAIDWVGAKNAGVNEVECDDDEEDDAD